MGRPKGSLNKPGSKKPGRAPGTWKLKAIYTAAQIVSFKAKILDLLDEEICSTLTAAARHIGVSPTRVYQWNDNDPEWYAQVKMARQVQADSLLKELEAVEIGHNSKGDPIMVNMAYVTARIFKLKAIRHEYRDNYKIELGTDKTAELLSELKKIGESALDRDKQEKNE